MDHSLNAGIVFTTRRIVFTIRILVTGTEQYLLETAGHTHIYAYVHVHVYLYLYVYVYVYLYLHLYLYVYVVHTHYIYIYISCNLESSAPLEGYSFKNDGIR